MEEQSSSTKKEIPILRVKGVDIPVQVVGMYMEGQREVLISTNTSIGPVQVRRRMNRRWWAEKMNGELKSLGLEDCGCRGDYSVERWTGLVMLAFTLLATVRYEGTTDGWPSWNEVGKKLARKLVRRGR